ncbi:DUF4232 domain-containing protein [Streptomyces sp. NPDC020875]|uniref:DUF4232 domain-containing protein n=1 Tax=Streptomyces sp. NPDC020875 TaxID=3154898 RepID=UPI0033E9AF5F
MRAATTTSPVIAAVLAGAVLLTACESDVRARQGDDCRTEATPSTGTGTGPGSGTGTGGESGARVVATTGLGPVPEECRGRERTVEFEVTNAKPEPYTYTVVLAVVDISSGRELVREPVTVGSVQAGGTVRRTFDAAAVPEAVPNRTRAEIRTVRSVPADEVGSPPGGCPPSGVRIAADQGNAAMGLRDVGVTLTNCGTRPYALNGHPGLTPLDEDHRPLDGVRILPGGGDIALVTGFDAAPEPLTLKPGESATTALMWRNTHTGHGAAANAPYVRLVPKPGAPPVTLIPELDLGTTGKLGVGAWKRRQENR